MSALRGFMKLEEGRQPPLRLFSFRKYKAINSCELARGFYGEAPYLSFERPLRFRMESFPLITMV